MRKTLLLLALLACAGPLAAQTIVSGTVADSSSNAYSYAVMSITNSTGKVRPDFNLTAGGAFSLQLPAGTYTFTASFAGVAPPVGTGPQTCTASNVAVSGSTQTITFSGCAGLIQLSGSGGGMVWPVGGAGVPNYSGTNSWGTSYSASNTLPENFLPAATVFTDQNATFGAHTYDFSGMTLGKWRLSAGLTTSANGDFGYDSTSSNWHFWNGADSIVAPLASGFVSGHCGQPTSSAGKWVIADTGAACGTSSGANPALSNLASVSINTALLFQTGVDVGSATNPLRNLYLFGSGTYGTTSFEFTGTPTAARFVTFPDATDTVVELTQTQILTNKSMSGASNTFTNIPLSAFTNLGTTTTVLHGNAAGNPSFGAVDLANDITGNL